MGAFELVIAAITLVEKGLEFLAKQKAIAAQDDSWTPAQRAEVDAAWVRIQSSPAWQTDEESGV